MAVQQEAVGHVDPYIQALGLALNLDEMELDIAPVLSELERAVDLAINDSPRLNQIQAGRLLDSSIWSLR